MKQLETERLVLREWDDGDRESFARMNADPMVMEFMPRLLSHEDSDRLLDRFKDHFKKHGYGLYVLERKKDGEFLGFVGLNNVDPKMPFAPAVEIAWRLGHEHWGHGYATEAAQRVLEYGFEELGLKEIVSFTVHDHSNSVHIMEKLGLTRDPKGDFEYPGLPKGHPLGRFVLYRIKAGEFARQAA
jgi:RimJ/RimL family protein N-acetyltransferase